MRLIKLYERSGILGNTGPQKTFDQFKKLLNELDKKDLPFTIISSINNNIGDINSNPCTGQVLKRLIIRKQSEIIKLLEKKTKIVPLKHYQKEWMSIGIAVFGLPIGVVFGTSLGNMAFLGVGLPIGLVIGQAVGMSMDKKAFREGRQLDIEI